MFLIPWRFEEVVRERRSKPRKALLGRERKMSVGVRAAGVDDGGITARRCIF